MSAAHTTPSYTSIQVVIEGPVGVVTLNRPEQLNAWDIEMSLELWHAYEFLEEDDAVRAIVLTGAGKAFCAGAALRSGGANWTDGRRDAALQKYGRLRGAAEVRKPVIAAINGAAVGAGITIAMGADIRVAADDAVLGFVFHRRGVLPDGDLLWSLPRHIGYSAAIELLLTGRKFTGAEAYRLGIASHVTSRAQVLPKAMEIANEIAENVAPVPAALTKLMSRALLSEPDQAAAYELQQEVFRWSVRQPDTAEGVASFKERRRPEWTQSACSDFPTDLFDDRRETRRAPPPKG